MIIKAGDDLFTQYIYKDEKRSKPILYPIIGPYSKPMTRKFPIEEAGDGEEQDHPHHASLWYTHGDVNGVDFWAVGKNKGKIVHQEFIDVTPNSFTATNLWKDFEGKTICQDIRTLTFHEFNRDQRAIDIEINSSSLKNFLKPIYLPDTVLEFKFSPEHESDFRDFFNSRSSYLRSQKYSKYIRSFIALENSGLAV